MILQRTVRKSIQLQGIGLHSGKPVSLILRPAAPNRGVVFVRTDLANSPEIAAHHKNVVNTQMATTLGRGGVTISTVEHLMAAFHGLGIDNAVVEVDGPEIPILDGSAHPYCEAIAEVGLQTQLQARPCLALRRSVEVKTNDKWAVAEPSSRLEIQASIDWTHPSIGYQELFYQEGSTPFSEISSARTFGFLRDVEALKRAGLARGGSLENAVVLDDNGVMNPGGLRYPDEFVRHKVLDALGDLKLAGVAIQAYIRLHKAGHDLHSQLMAEIFRDPDNYEIIGGLHEERETELADTAVFAPAYAGY